MSTQQTTASEPVVPVGAVDPLTGAAPRSELAVRLADELRLARGRGQPLSLLVIDLDHFKSVNDAFGHTRGDEVLREFGRRLRTVVRQSDLVIRYGGDEFVLVLPDTPHTAAIGLANRLLQAIGDAPFPGEPPLAVSVSIGAASFPDHATSAEELFHAADARLYSAKRAGRAQVAGRDPRSEAAAPQSPARLVERDSEFESLYAFLGRLASAQRGVFTIRGSRGTGRSRFLAETGKAAELMGYELVRLRGTAALQRRTLGSIIEADPALEQPAKAGVESLARVLADRVAASGGCGLLVAADDFQYLDETSLSLLQQLLEQPLIPVLALACVVDPARPGGAMTPTARHGAAVELRPFSVAGMRTWLRLMLQWEAPDAFLGWLHCETGGLPARITAALARLEELGLLCRREQGWQLDPHYASHVLADRLDPADASADTGILPGTAATIEGRDGEIRSAKQRLRDGRLLTLVGPGGFGKTRLALQIAAELGEELQHGAFHVPLAGVAEPESVLPAIAEALRLAFRPGTEPAAQLVEFLAGKQALLVLDNFEHVMRAAGLIETLLEGAPRLRLIVTSREALGLTAEESLPVMGVQLPRTDDLAEVARSPAVRLFVQHAQRHRPNWRLTPDEAPSIAAICRRLEGIPLAIEIAAALVRVLSCAEVLREIEGDLDALVAPDQEGTERHGSLRAVFDSSWQLLSQRERKALRQLSIFRGGFRRDAAQKVADASLRVLCSLTDKSLLTRSAAGRYQLHDVLRHYAYERLLAEPAECEQTEAKRCAFFAEFVYAHGDRSAVAEPGEVLEEVATETDNVRSALHWAVGRGDTEHTERLLKGFFRFLDLSSRYQEGKDLFAWAAERVSDPGLAAMIAARHGHFCAKLGEFKLASRLLRGSLAAYRALEDRRDVPLALYSLGGIAQHQGEFARAERLYRRSMRIFRQTGSGYGQALCLNELGSIAFRQGRYDEAEERFNRSLEIRSAIHDPAGMARCLNNLGMIADLGGDRPAARALFERSLGVSRRAGDRRQTANCLHNLGVLARRIGEDEDSAPLLHEAKRFLHEALEIYTEIGARGNVALCIYNLADLALVLGDYAEAAARFLDAGGRASAEGAVPLLLSVLAGSGRLLLRLGAKHRALELLTAVEPNAAAIDEDRQSVRVLLAELAIEIGADGVEAARRTSAAGLDAVVGRFTEMMRQIERGETPSDPRPPPASSPPPPRPPSGTTIEELTVEGQAAERNGHPAQARACYEAALHALDGANAGRAAALTRWVGRTFIAEGDLQAAADCIEVSLAMAAARTDLADQAHGLNLRGIVLFHRGEMDDAVNTYEASREFARRAGESQLVAMIDHNLGVIANVRGEVVRALEHYRRSLDGFRALGQAESALEVLNSLGMAYTRTRQYRQAEDCYSEVIRSCTTSGNTRLQLLTEGNRIALWVEQRRYDSARDACTQALELAHQLGDRRPLGELYMHHGVILRETGKYTLAEEQLERALSVATEIHNPLLAAETSREQAELFWRLQRNKETLQALNRAHRLFGQLQASRELADIDRRTADLETLFVDIVQRWSESIESADPYTQGHCVRVADRACALAEAAGMDAKTLFWFRLGALLHDVGKIVVPSEILNKPAQLTPEERAIIERHPDAGVELLDDIDFPWDVRPMVRHHHERWEGRGYPLGIAGDEIPFSARVLCIADVYDALTSDRPYREGFPHAKAIDIMENGMRGHFDPTLFPLFKEIAAREDAAAEPRSRRLRIVA